MLLYNAVFAILQSSQENDIIIKNEDFDIENMKKLESLINLNLDQFGFNDNENNNNDVFGNDINDSIPSHSKPNHDLFCY